MRLMTWRAASGRQSEKGYRCGYLPYQHGHPGYRCGIWANDTGDDSIDMVIPEIDMGYLATLLHEIMVGFRV
jgi:hypothetical protein